MAGGRLERCSGCGTHLQVPTEAQTVRCATCQTVTKLRPDYYSLNNNSLTQSGHDSINSAATRLRNAAMHTFVAAANNLGGALGNFSFPGSNNYNNNNNSYYNYCPRPGLGQTVVGPTWAAAPPPPRRRRAVLCGVSYLGRSYGLKGSYNDVNIMRYFLVEKMGFPVSSILTLTEYEANPLRIPTKRNMLVALKWLVEGCRPGDSLVFYFSGHGSRQRDTNHDEIDGYDESLCPVDYEIAGKILDDDINEIIVRPLPHAATLHAIIDACHSGTVLDLPFVCRMNREGYYKWEDHRRQSIYKGTNGGLAVSISSCDDNQTSADTNALSGGHTLTGAMTYSFIQAVQNEPGLTYGRLLGSIRTAIREAKTGIRLNGPIVSLVNKILCTELSQEPQLSSSEQFDIYSKPFTL